jgi:hypothetical protein
MSELDYLKLSINDLVNICEDVELLYLLLSLLNSDS